MYNPDHCQALLQVCENTLNSDPNNFYSLLLLGLMQYDLGHYGDALQTCERVIKLAPGRAYARYLKGRTLQKKNNAQDAEYAFNKSFQIPARSSDDWLRQSIALFDLGRYEEALQACDRAIHEDGNNAEAWRFKGDIPWERSNKPGCSTSDRERYRQEYEQAYAKAYAIESRLAGAKTGKDPRLKPGKVKRQTNESRTADEYYRKGDALYEKKCYQEALKAFDEAIKNAPEHANAWYGRGRALYELGRHKKALEAFDEALKALGDVLKAFIEALKVLNEALETFNEALEAFDEAIRNEPRHADFWRYRAIVLGQLNDKEKSDKAYLEAARISTQSSAKIGGLIGGGAIQPDHASVVDVGK